MLELEDIINEALIIRSKVERFAKEENNQHYLDWEDLMGCCAIASIALKKKVNDPRLRVVEGVVCGDIPEGENPYDYINHCWNEFCEEGYVTKIIDITATQFWDDVDKVYVTDADCEAYLKVRESADLRNFKGWVSPQRPTKDVINRILRL